MRFRCIDDMVKIDPVSGKAHEDNPAMFEDPFSGRNWKTMTRQTPRFRWIRTLCPALVLLSAAVPPPLAVGTADPPVAQEKPVGWPSYRGPARDGITAETLTIPPSGLKKLWDAQVGVGYSACSLRDGRLYTMGNQNGKDIIWCLDAVTGREIWRFSYDSAPGGGEARFAGPRCQPTLDGQRLYAFNNVGLLYCLDLDGGKEVWHKDLAAEYGVKAGAWGFTCSPLIAGEKVIVEAADIFALSTADGSLIWKAPGSSRGGYSSPVPFQHKGKTLYAVFCSDKLVVVDDDGKTVLDFPWKTQYGINAACPIYADGKLFISSNYGKGCALVDVDSGKAVYQNKVMFNHTNSCVLKDGYLYGFHGALRSDGGLKCIEFATGKEVWYEPMGNGYAMLAGNKLILQCERGDLAVAEASPKGYKELARLKAAVPIPPSDRDAWCWNTPVLADGRIYCRDNKGRLVCLTTREE